VLPGVQAQQRRGVESVGEVVAFPGLLRVGAHVADSVLRPGHLGSPVAVDVQGGAGLSVLLHSPGVGVGRASVVGAEDAQVGVAADAGLGDVLLHQPDEAVAEHGVGVLEHLVL